MSTGYTTPSFWHVPNYPALLLALRQILRCTKMRSFNPDHVTTVEETDWLGSVKCSDTILNRQNTCLLRERRKNKQDVIQKWIMNTCHPSRVLQLRNTRWWQQLDAHYPCVCVTMWQHTSTPLAPHTPHNQIWYWIVFNICSSRPSSEQYYSFDNRIWPFLTQLKKILIKPNEYPVFLGKKIKDGELTAQRT